MEIVKIEKALEELRKQDKRKFIQTVDLIVNLHNFDTRKESVNAFISMPHAIEKKVCAFLTKKSGIVDTIVKEEFDRYKDESDIKKLAKKYDFFIASASLMPLIATKFGRVFGPMGKMPSPQAGIISAETDENIKAMAEKMKKMIRVRSKDRSLKIAAGKEDMRDKELEENINIITKAVENALPRKKENIKNILIKFTMTKPVRIA